MSELSKIEQLQKQLGEALEQLTAANRALDEARKQEPFAWGSYDGRVITKSAKDIKATSDIFTIPLYAAPTCAKVAVPDDWNAQCTCGHRWHAVMPTENCPSCNPSPRITEQDALQIIKSWSGYFDQDTFEEWVIAKGIKLLAKLNGEKS